MAPGRGPDPGAEAGVQEGLTRPGPLPSEVPTVTKADIIDRIAAGTGLTKIETEAVVNGFVATVRQALKQGERIDIRGFGTFKVQHRAARVARNPRTNEELHLEAQYVPVFKPSREFRQGVDEAVKALPEGERDHLD